MSDDLVTWLRQALDDDERTAQTAAIAMGMDEPVYPDYRTYNGQEQEDADAYLIRFSPARVLAEVAAKRAILDWVERELADDPTQEMPREIAAHLAQPLADRPGYQESWRPA